MTTTRIRTHVGTAAWLIALLAASMTLLMTVGARPTSAFEGSFCAGETRAEGVYCESVTRSSIRRAIGHTKDAYSNVGIETTTEYLEGDCRSIECTANTGYLNKDGTGSGYIWNEGPNGTQTVSGFLYP